MIYRRGSYFRELGSTEMTILERSKWRDTKNVEHARVFGQNAEPLSYIDNHS